LILFSFDGLSAACTCLLNFNVMSYLMGHALKCSWTKD